MASELKLCPFCQCDPKLIRPMGERLLTDKPPYYGPEKYRYRCSSSTCCAMTNCHNTEEEARSQWNTRPAPAATDTGLETVAWQRKHPTAGWMDCGEEYIPHYRDHGQEVRELSPRSQAAELLAAERAENDEAYELGKRDGFSEAVQEIDLKTGGDGEYRYCTDHDPDRHTPDPASMIQRIVERFETLNTMESISEIHEWKERAEKAEADNAAKDARIKELADALKTIAHPKALTSLSRDKARAVLGGKPS